MTRPKFIGLILLLLMGTAGTALAARRVDWADTIVFGEIQSGRQDGSLANFNLLVDRTIKGSVQSGTLLPVRFDNAFSRRTFPNRTLSGFYGIWFLKRDNATWTLDTSSPVIIENAYLPVPKTSIPELSTNAVQDVGDQIAAALLPQILHYKDIKQISRLAGALLDLDPSSAIVDMYHQLASSADRELHFMGLVGLAIAHDPAALDELVGDIDEIPSLKLKSLLLRLIQRLDGDPQSVQALGKFAASPDVDIQYFASQTLSLLHSRDSMPFLAALLDSRYQRIRENAVRGMSYFVNNKPPLTAQNGPSFEWLPPQGPTPWKTPETDAYGPYASLSDPAHEPAYLNFWKSWWAQMKDEVMAGQ